VSSWRGLDGLRADELHILNHPLDLGSELNENAARRHHARPRGIQ
jgi:hypothetical protein